MSELVEHVDEQDRVLGVVERGEAERQHWPHRIATTLCRDRAGRILMLRRSETHPRFPGYYDVMVGGAGDVGESYEEAAVRELSEELGVRVPLRFMFKFLCREGISPAWFGVHEAVVTDPLIPDPGEIAWQGWLTEAELCEVVDQRLFVPEDGKLCADTWSPDPAAVQANVEPSDWRCGRPESERAFQLQDPITVVRGAGRRLTWVDPATASRSRTLSSCWAASRARAWPRKSLSSVTVCSDAASRSRSLALCLEPGDLGLARVGDLADILQGPDPSFELDTR